MKNNNLICYTAFPLVIGISIAWVVMLSSTWEDMGCSDAQHISGIIITLLIASAGLFLWKIPLSQKNLKKSLHQ